MSSADLQEEEEDGWWRPPTAVQEYFPEAPAIPHWPTQEAQVGFSDYFRWSSACSCSSCVRQHWEWIRSFFSLKKSNRCLWWQYYYLGSLYKFQGWMLITLGAKSLKNFVVGQHRSQRRLHHLVWKQIFQSFMCVWAIPSVPLIKLLTKELKRLFQSRNMKYIF